jgi:hypothetical protein
MNTSPADREWVADVQRVETEPAALKDADGVPYCRRHHCRMKCASGGKKSSPTLYYACPVPDCDEKAQRVKGVHERVVPAGPQACPRCSRPGREIFCERDPHHSTAAAVVLKCPACGWKSNALVVPHLAALHLTRRPGPRAADVGDR